MTFISVDLPAPAANASGAAVDVSAMGALKTISILGNGFTFEPSVQIEVSLDAGATKWAPITLTAGQSSILVACHWMRATVSNYKGGGSPTVSVGAERSGTLFQSLNVPSDNGSGTPSSTLTLPSFKSVQVGGPFGGNLTVEASQDGGVTYSQVLSFGQPGLQTAEYTGNYMRVSRNGVPLNNPGLPIVNIAATNAGTGGGNGAVDFAPARTLFVAKSWPLGADPNVFFTTIQSALDYAGANFLPLTAANHAAIVIYPGLYTENLTLVSNVSLTGVAADSVRLAGTVTWLAGQGVNAPQAGATEQINFNNIFNAAGITTIDDTAKTGSGNLIFFSIGCSINGINAIGRGVNDNYFLFNAILFATITASNISSLEIFSSRTRGLALSGSTFCRIQGGEIFLTPAVTHTLTGTSQCQYQGLDLSIPITVNTGCSIIASGCDLIATAPTLTVNAGGSADIRGSNYRGNSNIVGAGTIDRSTWTQQTGATGVGANAITLNPPYPDANYNVSAQLVSGPGNAATTITAKAGSGFTLTDSVGGNVWDLTVIAD